jgi:uncharacterized RDD family membrane protein YckC
MKLNRLLLPWLVLALSAGSWTATLADDPAPASPTADEKAAAATKAAAVSKDDDDDASADDSPSRETKHGKRHHSVTLKLKGHADAKDDEEDSTSDGDGRGPEISVKQDYKLPAGKTATNGVVVVLGNATLEGNSGGDVVVVLGSAKVDGDVKGDLVSVLGDVDLNGKVSGSVVSVGGGVHLGPKADVGEDAVGIGNGVDRDDNAKVHGEIVPIGGFGGLGHAPAWITSLITDCAMKLRPLGFHAPLAWFFSIVLLLLYLLLALVFPDAVQTCARNIRERPISTFLLGLAGVPLAVGATVILCVILIGLPLVPFLWAGMFVAALIGKAGFFAFLGGAVFRRTQSAASVAAVVFVGWVIVTITYLVPVLGLITWKVTAMWGLGAALQAAFTKRKKEASPTAPLQGPPGFRPSGAGGGASGPIAPISPVGPAAQGAVLQVQTGLDSTAGQAPIPATPSGSEAVIAAAAVPLALAEAFAAPSTTAHQPPAGDVLPAAAPLEPISTPVSEPTDALMPTIAPGLPGIAAGPAPAPAGSTPPISRPVGRSTITSAGPAASPVTGLDATTLPRVKFWPRFWVAAVDLFLPFLVFQIFAPAFLDLAYVRVAYFLAYFAAFHVWRGATPMAIVFGQKVVRVDGRIIDIPCALVRALMSGFGGLCLGLGFLWCAWDPERQTWADKLAGTVVVKLPKNEPLV